MTKDNTCMGNDGFCSPATMKVNDLRIGNWYLSVKWGVPVKCDLSDLYNLCVNSDGAYDDPPINEMFAPLSLTIDWLIKFGFKLSDINGVVLNKKMILFKGRGRWRVMYHNTHVKYVHQLQNLYYALTGEELTIE